MKWTLTIALTGGMVVCASVSIAGAQQATAVAAGRASIAFRGVTPDVRVREFLDRYRLKPVAIYMAAAGQVGTHRVSPAKASSAAVSDARLATRRIAEGSAKSSKRRAARFLERTTEAQMASDSIARKRGRSFLAAVEQDSILGTIARGDAPVIYGVEVIGDAADVSAASRDAMVRAFEPAVTVDGRVVVPRVPVPDNLRPSTSTPGTDRLTPQDIRARLRRVAGQP
jgi:hypothetical protein